MNVTVDGFLQTKNQKIINGNGQEIFLTGVGLGNWLLPEGYMWKFGKGYGRPRTIEKLIQNLLGKKKADDFWSRFYRQYITEADIQQIAREGFNSIRLPINSRFILREGSDQDYISENIQLIDRLIGWCKKHKLYVFLDLHGAPGGQTGSNI
ncbi:MAG: cellulase family glycosylhydrolase, partial [bacterium]